MLAERVAVHSAALHPPPASTAIVPQPARERAGAEPSPASPLSSGQTQAFKNIVRAYLRKQNQTKQPASLHSWSLITHVARLKYAGASEGESVRGLSTNARAGCRSCCL